ncbi:MAG: 30S ribosomal protein S20 [Anaerolineae bacterium]|nr:30S ribosomal protein S20 [Anaerolineae bacterium]
MANTQSAVKAARQNERRRRRNRMVRSATRTYVKKARVALVEGDIELAQEAVRQAVVALDKAAQKGIIHRNNASRRKARLMRQLNRIGQME